MPEDTLEQIKRIKFEVGRKEADSIRLIENLRRDLASKTDEKERKRYHESLRWTEQRHWLMAENPVLWVYVENGVPDSKAAEAAFGMKRLIVQPYGLNMTFEVVKDRGYITDSLASICQDPDIVAGGLTTDSDPRRLAGKIMNDYRTGDEPAHGSVVITRRDFKGPELGITDATNTLVIVSNARARNLEVISAHELLHYIGAVEENCGNTCLMNFHLTSETLCPKCYTSLVAYTGGLDSVMREHGRHLLVK
ncbi:hypothetical protein KY360_04850 [Candidatus Woesearchaeota archaeon]|nr:hypothetical protein [Candidatus Woesearchaeota archaeon]